MFKRNKHVCKFETSVVLRNKKDWFAEIENLQPLICVLQEELAFMYEMLGLFEDALIQYDELDALFTQYILFFAAGSMYYICITFVLHITHQVLHTVNKLLFCARNFCEDGKSLIVVNISHHKQVFDKYMYLFVARNIHYFFLQKLFPNSIAQWIKALDYYKYGSYEFESSGGFY